MPLMAVEREENGREGCACACGWREKKREEKGERERERERERREHAAKRVIESRARSLLYRPPYAYPVPFPQHPTPCSPFLSLTPSRPRTFSSIRLRFFSIRLHFPTIGIGRHRSRRRSSRGGEKKEGEKSVSVYRIRARKENFPFFRGKEGGDRGLINIIGDNIMDKNVGFY